MASVFILIGHGITAYSGSSIWTLPEDNYGTIPPQFTYNADSSINSRAYAAYNGKSLQYSSWIFPINFKGASDEAFNTWKYDYGRFLFKYVEGVTVWREIAIKQDNDHIAGNHFGYDHASKRIKRVNFSLSGSNYSFTSYGAVESQPTLNNWGFTWSHLNGAGFRYENGSQLDASFDNNSHNTIIVTEAPATSVFTAGTTFSVEEFTSKLSTDLGSGVTYGEDGYQNLVSYVGANPQFKAHLTFAEDLGEVTGIPLSIFDVPSSTQTISAGDKLDFKYVNIEGTVTMKLDTRQTSIQPILNHVFNLTTGSTDGNVTTRANTPGYRISMEGLT